MEYDCESNVPGPSNISDVQEKSTRCLNCKKVNAVDVQSEQDRYNAHTPKMKEKIDLYKPGSKSKDKSRNFSSTPSKTSASDLEDFNDYSDGLSVVVPERKKKKRYREVSFNDNKEIDDEIEDQLKRKAKKSNLTVANVKSIIKHVISNDNIINFIKKSMREGQNNDGDDLDFCYELKLTRSKTKQLLQNNSEIIWPITPIKKPEEGEHLILVNEELPEESDDEEYKPEPDDLQDQSEEESGRQSVVSSISCSSTLDSQYIESFDPNLLNSDPHPTFKIPEENIGQRTRSKLCLSDTPLETIETAYLPPDITTDMYDYECDNEDWVNFLKDFMQPLPKDPEDDDEADPEYNVMADEEVVDKEEFRMDRASKVSRKEERDLYRELIEECILGHGDTSDEEEESYVAKETSNQVTLEIREPVRPMKEEKQQLQQPERREEAPEHITANQIQLIEQQMRQFVQIVTQNFLQTYQHPLYRNHAVECKTILATMVELANLNENSYHNAFNLKPAFALVEDWERHLLTEKGNEVVKHMEDEVKLAKIAQKKNNYHRVRFHPSLLDLMSNSEVFLYPLLLPPEAFRCDGPFRVEFTFEEDCLIAIGLEEFSQHLSKTSKNNKVTERSAVESICKYLLPTKKPSQVERHIRNVKNLESNPINMTNGIRGVRLRAGRSNDASYEVTNNGASRREKRPQAKLSNVSAPTSYIFLFLLLYTLIFYLQCYLENYHLPTPLMYDDIKNHPGEFIADRAMDRLMKLTDIGPRVAGSYENEVLAVKVLKDEIDKIMKEAKPIHRIEVDIQKYSGSFPLEFLDGLTNVYRDIQDVIVKFGPREYSSHSLLINCHFDSVVDSPGGSDDGAGCATMLEILKVLSVSDEQLKNNIIFLFNGAEENLMHGSHGFITQHPWAKEIRAFINLEACGAGGREVLFQSGPNSPWIMETYAKNVKYPFASSMAQEVFESRIIPGDTDFRVFRDFGNVSGLDFAWSTNGYVYHTKYDNIDQIPLGSLQRTGDNMLALAKGMVNAHELSNVEKYKEGNLIYFDVLGIFLLRWPEAVGAVINISSILLSVFLIYWSIKDARRKGLGRRSYLKIFSQALGVIFLGAICSTLVVLSISAFVSLIGRSMSWYSRPTWLLFLYVIPSAVTIMALQHYFSVNQLKVTKSKMLLFQIYFDVYLFLWTFLLLVSVILRIRSGYVVWLWVIGPSLGILIQRCFGSPLTKRPDAIWFLSLFCSLLVPVIQHTAKQVGCLGLFIPIMGRIGAGNNSEIIIALFTNVTFGLILTYISSLIVLVEKPRKVLTSLSTLFLVALFLLLFTPLGFPYSGSTPNPKPQRFMMIHTERSFHNRQGKEIGSESGYWLVDHDYNSPFSVKSFVPEMSYAKFKGKDCEKYLYCGLPYLMPVTSFIWKTHWIAANPPKIEVPTSLKVLSRESIENNIERITLEIKGPDHMGVIISPKTNVKFVRWSINEHGPLGGPLWNGQETYFIYHASASDLEPWVFSLDFKVPQFNETVMDFALLGHFLHGPRKTGLEFRKILAQFPPWTAVTSWTATYKSFVL